uniref:Lipase maturation factor 1 n=1 Tax=Cyanistes caeruleus TaxID=156563 RepID=A0A8C0ZK59_CYACU
MLAVPDMAAPSAGLRQRGPGRARAPDGAPGAALAASPESPEPGLGTAASPLSPGTFWLTRIVLLRSIAFLYSVAFLVAFEQNKQLIGEKGLLPCKLYLQDIKKYFKGKVGLDALSYAPTLIWFLDWSAMDSTLDCLALAGLALAAFVLLTGCANMVLMSLLWLLYLSLVNVGQIWYSFGALRLELKPNHAGFQGGRLGSRSNSRESQSGLDISFPLAAGLSDTQYP